MYLKELYVFGFKSFPEKTNLTFEPGITIVVGPNGCGKSNFLDSIKWALGEQSPKSLRGAKMEDIIFNGTDNHPALNYAEVSLLFSNENNYLPIEYKEVLITRRLYRSGESQYFINKNAVRLKDIQDLFLGTGVGESTYSFIEQGKIEVFLSYKPEEKRLIFDEASGIVKYKDRKRETLKRLKETEDNLLRFEDILSEVKRQIRYLERQVEKANRYKKAKDNLIAIEEKIASLQAHALEEEIKVFGQDLTILNQENNQQELKLQELRELADQLEQQKVALRKTLEDLNSFIVSSQAGISTAQSHINMYEQNVKDLNERKVSLEQTKQNLTKRLEVHQRRMQEENVRLKDLDSKLSQFQQQLDIWQQEKDAINKEVHSASITIEQDKQKILELESRKVVTHNELIEVRTQLGSLVSRKKRLFLDQARLTDLMGQTKERLDSLEAQVSGQEKVLSEFKLKKISLLQQEQEWDKDTEIKKQLSIEREKTLVELQAYYEFLKDLRLKYDTFSVRKKVTIIFDEEPKQINKLIASLQDVNFCQHEGGFSAQVEAKVISFEETQLEERMRGLEQEIKSLKEELETRNLRRNELKEEIAECERLSLLEDKKWQEIAQAYDAVRRDWQRFSEENELVLEEMRETLENVVVYEAKQKDFQAQLDIDEDSLALAKTNLTKAQNLIRDYTQRVQEINVEFARSDAQRQSLCRQQEDARSKMELFEEEKQNIVKHFEEIEKDQLAGQNRLVSLGEEIEKLNKQIEEQTQGVVKKCKDKEKVEKDDTLCQEQLMVKKDEIDKLTEVVEETKNAIYAKKMKIQGLAYEKEKLLSYLSQVYQLEFKPIEVSAIEESKEVLVIEKETLQNKMKSLGEVNLACFDEFEELKNREQFLEQQKQDLIESKENLKKAIQKINRTSKELFLETFTKIEEEFKKNFRLLFNGGRARLILLDPENILESGVEIEVQPPGKKLQNVSLLSGGEKALTAISLVFAIFRVRPSPICVLDEIDAPLDEANVDRFNQILREFARESQFIVITHNKKTMSNADVLYGVTMQEKGISKVVSVKFAQDQAIPA